jgi:hypothetical protein
MSSQSQNPFNWRHFQADIISVPPEMRHSAKPFFSKVFAAPHTGTPRVITVDKNAAYPKAWKRAQSGKVHARLL